jgi:hypothetical protein
MKKKEIPTYITPWMNPEDIIHSGGGGKLVTKGLILYDLTYSSIQSLTGASKLFLLRCTDY